MGISQANMNKSLAGFLNEDLVTVRSELTIDDDQDMQQEQRLQSGRRISRTYALSGLIAG